MPVVTMNYFVKSKHNRLHDRYLNPAFHFEHLKSFVPTFADRSEALSERWACQLDAGDDDWIEVNMHTQIAALTLDVVGLTAFGFDFNAIEEKGSALEEAFKEIFSNSGLSISLLLRVYTSNKIPTPQSFR